MTALAKVRITAFGAKRQFAQWAVMEWPLVVAKQMFAWRSIDARAWM
jgi:hypothetical protein